MIGITTAVPVSAFSTGESTAAEGGFFFGGGATSGNRMNMHQTMNTATTMPRTIAIGMNDACAG